MKEVESDNFSSEKKTATDCVHHNTLLKASGAAILSALTLISSAAAAQSTQKPNVIWITVEDISPLLSAYGDSTAKTPNIDKLASDGILFNRAYTTSGVCAPSRASLITGMYQTSFGAQHMRTGGNEFGLPSAQKLAVNEAGLPKYSAQLPAGAKPFPEILREAGYFTSNNHKTDYQFETLATIWDETSPAASYQHRSSGKPFFSVFNFAITHESMINRRKDDPLQVDPAKLTIPPIFPDTPTVRNNIARLYTNIERMDHDVGELIQQLKNDGVYDQSYIFFFSDNGGNLPWMKREITERGTHIPLIVKLPRGLAQGERSNALVSGVDFAPTVLSIAGVDVPKTMHGSSFIKNDKVMDGRKYVFAARDRMDNAYDRVRMVRDSRYRYLFNYQPEKPYYQEIPYRVSVIPMMKEIVSLHQSGSLPAATEAWFKTKPKEELYDLENDPWEQHNLAGDPRYSKKLDELRSAFSEWSKNYLDMGNLTESELISQLWSGAKSEPQTAKPKMTAEGDLVTLTCETPGASIGYWIEGKEGVAPRKQTVRSWDFAVYAFGFANGQQIDAAPVWDVYKGEKIRLAKGDVLHVQAQKLGYGAARNDFSLD